MNMKLEIEAADKLFCPSSQLFVLKYEEEELLMYCYFKNCRLD